MLLFGVSLVGLFVVSFSDLLFCFGLLCTNLFLITWFRIVCCTRLFVSAFSSQDSKIQPKTLSSAVRLAEKQPGVCRIERKCHNPIDHRVKTCLAKVISIHTAQKPHRQKQQNNASH
eukprot:TRINITY_DN3172_c0_g1_i2.p1 TRINITY_DN3172_c0_g1~~TRINITY_DN3172_c0_g1_i2.p1  ORF type:complete len:117 (-),score=1.26 TRINITY_DN3172_c0_g1_i2:53-403(-)